MPIFLSTTTLHNPLLISQRNNGEATKRGTRWISRVFQEPNANTRGISECLSSTEIPFASNWHSSRSGRHEKLQRFVLSLPRRVFPVWWYRARKVQTRADCVFEPARGSQSNINTRCIINNRSGFRAGVKTDGVQRVPCNRLAIIASILLAGILQLSDRRCPAGEYF